MKGVHCTPFLFVTVVVPSDRLRTIAELNSGNLRHEVLAASDAECRAYLYGALHDAHVTQHRRTVRFGQKTLGWHGLVRHLLTRLGHRSWTYREGRDRQFWVTETSAPWLKDVVCLSTDEERRGYTRGYFDAEGTIPRPNAPRCYIQFVQKNHSDLSELAGCMEALSIACGKLHNPSRSIDAEMWRFYVRARSHGDFLALIGSWHPAKRPFASAWKERLAERASASD